MLSRIQVLIRHQRNQAKYDYTHVTMAVKRCGIVVAAPSHLPLPPGPHPPSTAESRPTNTSKVWSYPPMQANPCRDNGSLPHHAHTTHSPQATASKNSPSQPRERTSQQHALTSYAYATLRSTQSWSKTNSGIWQNAVNKQIYQKSQKTNPNSNVLFEVRIFMAILWKRAGHYIFALWFLSFFLLPFFPRLISAVGDLMATILPHMVWP